MYTNWALLSIARIYKNVCWTRAAQTLDTHRNMHAYLALALALAAPALAAAAPQRIGYEREIGTLVPKMLNNYVLSDDHLASQKNRFNVETKPRPDEPTVDNVILESQVLQIRPLRQLEEQASGDELVRQRRGYNLENVRVPARYPYLPVANFNRFRRWG